MIKYKLLLYWNFYTCTGIKQLHLGVKILIKFELKSYEKNLNAVEKYFFHIVNLLVRINFVLEIPWSYREWNFYGFLFLENPLVFYICIDIYFFPGNNINSPMIFISNGKYTLRWGTINTHVYSLLMVYGIGHCIFEIN